mmetsp:Transcript_59259/g.130046  ORF Transcript_59259/g.130046 Transcript_59259/m.130046 type:complete len:306 (-) Transcript_59259:258-1175(-)
MTCLSRRAQKILLATPLVCCFAQFFLLVPDLDTCQKIYDVFGLLSALLLVVVYAIPGTVEYDELVAADVRFGYTDDHKINPPPPNAYSEWWQKLTFYDTSPTFSFGAAIAIAGFCFSVVFLTVIFQYIYIGFVRAMLKHTKPAYRNEAWKKWYTMNAVITLIMVMFLMAGLISFYVGLFVMCIIKWPDLGLALVNFEGTFLTVNILFESDTYTQLFILNCLCPAVALVLLVLGGIGNYLVFSTLVDHEDPEATHMDEANAGELQVHDVPIGGHTTRGKDDGQIYPGDDSGIEMGHSPNGTMALMR